jgi:hypothetical protein
VAISLTACAGLFGSSKREGVSSSLVDYLYPDGEEPPGRAVNVPNLELPLKVGLAFVPVSETKSSSTLVDLECDLRASQRKGFEQAMADMTVNLDKELTVFKERIRTDESVPVTHVTAAAAAQPARVFSPCWPACRSCPCGARNDGSNS